MLPFIWGNFDARLNGQEAVVLERLDLLAPSKTSLAMDLGLRNPPDTSTGNYLRLCIGLPPAAVGPSVRLPSWRTVNHGDSWKGAGSIKLTYGLEPVSTFVFALIRPDPASPGLPASLVDSFRQGCKRYVIRLSSQYAWSSGPPSRIHLESNTAVSVESAELLAGD
jgi:hypothetical protein